MNILIIKINIIIIECIIIVTILCTHTDCRDSNVQCMDRNTDNNVTRSLCGAPGRRTTADHQRYHTLLPLPTQIHNVAFWNPNAGKTQTGILLIQTNLPTSLYFPISATTPKI